MAFRLSTTQAVWLAPTAFLAHCAEELPRFPRWATKHFGTTSTRFYVVSHALVIVPAVVMPALRATQRPGSTGAAFSSVAVAAGLGFNGIFHLATTALFREYSPGVFTGVFALLPAATHTIASARRGGVLTQQQLRAALVAGAAGCTAAVASLYLDMPTLGGAVHAADGARTGEALPRAARGTAGS